MSTIAYLMAFAVVARLGWGDFQRRGGDQAPAPVWIIHGLTTGFFASMAGIGFAVLIQ